MSYSRHAKLRTMRCALFSQFKSPVLPSLRAFPQLLSTPARIRRISRSTAFHLHDMGPPETDEEKDVDSTVEAVLQSVRTRAIAWEDAVARIVSFAKNQSSLKRSTLCVYLWHKSFEAARHSTDSAAAVADFLSELSNESQEDNDDHLEGSIIWPVRIEDDHGQRDRLWTEMPFMNFEIHDRFTQGLPPEDIAPEERKAVFDGLLKDRYFMSLLYLSDSSTFASLEHEIFMAFYRATLWPPPYYIYGRRRDREFWILASLIHLDAAGAELKDSILSYRPEGFHLGWWLQWQRRFLAIAEDDTVDMELRETAKRAHDKMAIESHVTNRWFRRWGHWLPEIASDPDEDNEDRKVARRTYDILASEDAKVKKQKQK